MATPDTLSGRLPKYGELQNLRPDRLAVPGCTHRDGASAACVAVLCAGLRARGRHDVFGGIGFTRFDCCLTSGRCRSVVNLRACAPAPTARRFPRWRFYSASARCRKVSDPARRGWCCCAEMLPWPARCLGLAGPILNRKGTPTQGDPPLNRVGGSGRAPLRRSHSEALEAQMTRAARAARWLLTLTAPRAPPFSLRRGAPSAGRFKASPCSPPPTYSDARI